MKYLRTCLSAVLAGIAVAVSGAVYLSAEPKSPIFASLMFSVGFLTALIFELQLFTDKIGYLFTGGGRFAKRLASILFILLGNIVGACLSGIALNCVVGQEAAARLLVKETFSAGEVLVRAIFCGMLMFVSAHGYRRREGSFTGFVLSVMTLCTVALCGFEHVLVNFFYAAAAFRMDNDALLLLVLSLVGNVIGALVFSTLYTLKKEDGKKNSHSGKHHHHKHKEEAKEEVTEEKSL